MNWSDYFQMMDDWKKLPAYRAEPRIDSLVGYYLLDFMTEREQNQMVGIIPELPIRQGTAFPEKEKSRAANLSDKVDFYMLGENGINYFIEFKTDIRSRRDKQDEYLLNAKKVGMSKVVDGIRRISKATASKDKYEHLLQKLKNFGLLDDNNKFSGKSTKIKIIYFQPNNKKNEPNCITFEAFAEWLINGHSAGDFEYEFAQTLLRWGE